jgi:ABC-2 type transport system permease protein
MRKIFRIACFELTALFYSPIAWLVLIIFTIQCGLDFSNLLETVNRAQRMGMAMDRTTARIFSGRFHFHDGVKDTLYLYIPLLTMGLMSREISSGSIKLLLSSPLKVRDIVLGKYLAMVAYCLILVGILALFGLAGAYSIRSLDWGLVICGLIGLFLLICAYSAIGLYMSTLTAYQVVAAISTLAVLALLNFIGGLFQTNEVVRHITYFLSVSGRTEQFINGLISTEDVLYFLIIIALFLFFTEFKLQAGRESKSRAAKAGRYALLFLLTFLTGYLGSIPALTGYLDMTATKTQTLTRGSREVIKKMDKPLCITTYVNILEEKYDLATPEGNSRDEKSFDMYRRYIPGLKMDYVYYYDRSNNGDEDLFKQNPGLSLEALAKKRAFVEGMDFKQILSPEEIRRKIDLRPEENRLVRLFQYGERKTFLRYFNDMFIFASEKEITAALKRLVEPSDIPKIGFLTGNNERSNFKAGDADYKMVTSELTFRYSLINQGFDVDSVSLQNGDMDTSWKALVIADPKIKFSEPDLEKIKRYIGAGGNVLIVGEPGRQDLLNPVVADLGVRFMAGRLIQRSQDFAPDFVLSGFSEGADRCIPGLKLLRQSNAVVSTSGVTALQYNRHDSLFHICPLLVSNEADTWNRPGSLDADSGNVSYDPAHGDKKAAFPLALALTREIGGKEQRIMIVGDADFMSNAEMAREAPKTKNFDFITDIFSWLNYGRFPIDTSRPKMVDVININRNGMLLTRIVFFCALPILLLAAGASLLIIRKRR